MSRELVFLKMAVLRLLKEHRPGYVSGEELCKGLEVTRTAVWKHIQSLRGDGYDIEARPRAGYLLVGIPDRLYPEEIQDGLTTKFIGRQVFYNNSLASTNDLAKELASRETQISDGTIVVAEEQTGGRGRLGREWFSPKYRAICFSLILYPPVSPSEVSRVTMVTAVALAAAIRNETGVPVGIKWPNDLLVGGKKLCGILTELGAEIDKVNYLVVGAGVNVNQGPGDFPEEVRDIATSLKIETGVTVNRVKLLQAMLAEFERWYRVWLEHGFAEVLTKWREMSVSLHCPVCIHAIDKSWNGWAEDVDEDGALMIRLPDGELQRVVAGDVSLRV
ncbi:MAG: Bifunctional ligase/repressor BirA [Pelotomaculum sp. PtaB.Bin104]|nr:MAG: Bifunctional ligase/repressor BirA [Pelotomaculum sp. PtaB.Bin104]